MYDILKQIAPTKPYNYRDFKEYDALYSYKRRDFTENYSWAVPSEEAIKKIVEFAGEDTILEIGAGSGLWAYLINHEGGKIIATDNYKSHAIHGKFFEVEKLKHTSALEKYPHTICNVLMLCWPPYSDQMADHSLRLFKGNKVIYIGESMGGCTATDNFHTQLENNFDCEDVYIPQWEALHDYMQLGVRKRD